MECYPRANVDFEEGFDRMGYKDKLYLCHKGRMSRLIIRSQTNWYSLNLSELWSYRELFYFLSWRDVKVKYKQTFLGITWVILQPILMVVIFTFFFSRTLSIPSDGMPYQVFCFSGIIFWNLFSSGMASAGNSLVANSHIIKKIYFPRLIIPVSALFVALFDALITMLIFFVILLLYHFTPKWIIIVMFPLALLITMITTAGIGMLLAALNIKYRDFRYIIPFLVQVLLFATPVIYPVSMIKHEWLKFLISLNPMTAAIEVARAGLTGVMPGIMTVITGSIVALFLLFSGMLVFRKMEPVFADFA